MILGRYLIISLVLNIKPSKNVIKGGGETLKGFPSPMIDLGIYTFKDLVTDEITLEEPFMNAYIEELFESGQLYISIKNCVQYYIINIKMWI